MAKIKWDQTGQKLYETGVDHGVLYPYGTAELRMQQVMLGMDLLM